MSDDTGNAEKSVKKCATMPGRRGGTLKVGGDHARPGRPPNEYRESLRQLLDAPKVRAAVEAVMSNAKHPQFAALYRSVVSQAHGNPTQPITVDPEALASFRVECE